MSKEAERKRIIEKVQKMIARADSERNPFEAEVETSMRLAKKLMDEYNLTFTEVELREKSSEDISKVHSGRTGRLHHWEKLMGRVCEILFTVEAILHRTGYDGVRMMFVGYTQDAELASKMYKHFHMILWIMGGVAYPHDRVGKRCYMEGVVERLVLRAEEEKELCRQMAVKSSCTALVLVKEDEIRKWIDENLNMTRTRSSRRAEQDWAAHDNGFDDGGSVDLGYRSKVDADKAGVLE